MRIRSDDIPPEHRFYLTPGYEYQVLGVLERYSDGRPLLVVICGDDDSSAAVEALLYRGCAHLKGGLWTVIEDVVRH